MARRRVGIVGFGNLGKFLYEELLTRAGEYEIVFVWNRTAEVLRGVVPDQLILEDLTKCAERRPDVIVEVAHPSITAQYGSLLVATADYLIGSPTALSDPQVYQSLLSSVGTPSSPAHGIYVATGALWGAQDIKKMADRGTLQGLKVTMKKHPSMLRLVGPLADRNNTVTDTAVTLYEGPVRELCPLAPNNVNTMATAAILAHNLGFDKVIGCLVSDPKCNKINRPMITNVTSDLVRSVTGLQDLTLDHHVVEVEVLGPGSRGNRFSVNTVRLNPAPVGAVTGKQTFVSFLSSLLAAKGCGQGIHVC